MEGNSNFELPWSNVLYVLYVFGSCPFSIHTFSSGTGRDYKNVAIGKPSMHIDTFNKAGAHLANDGNTNGSYFFCSRTVSSTDTWWMVDLLNSYNIHAVQMKNRDKKTSGKLRDFYVYVTETNPLSLITSRQNNPTEDVCLFHEGLLPPSGLQYLPCDNNKVLTGRYVFVWKPGQTGQLYLCEVEALTKLYPWSEFPFTIFKGSKSNRKPLVTKSLGRITHSLCVIFCLEVYKATFEMMQLNKVNGDCFCFETKPFEDIIFGENLTSDERFDVIKAI